MTRVLLLASTRAYHTEDFVAAAGRLGIELVLGTDRCHMLAEEWPEGAIALNFRDPDEAAQTIVERAQPVRGIVPTDEVTSVIAARAAALLELPSNPIDAARAAGDKRKFRAVMTRAGAPQPTFTTVAADAVAADVTAAMAGAGLAFPIVLKPLHLSASRGVMRVDDRVELTERLARLQAILRDPEVASDERAQHIVLESFIAGREVAFEGLVTAGQVRALAMFDKPDPLDGPFFAETIYVTPSRESPAVQRAITDAVTAATAAIGLREGPIHAELRVAADGPVVIELAARSIGGLCSRALTFGAGISLEALILAHAAGRDIADVTERAPGASGVFMLPVPERGVLRGVTGVDDARAIDGIRDVVITAREGQLMEPLPEGDAYVGFVFATADTPEAVEAALRRAGQAIAFEFAPLL